MLMMIVGAQGGGGSNAKMMNFGKSRAKMSSDTKKKLADVAGLAEEKEDLEEMMSVSREVTKKYEGKRAGMLRAGQVILRLIAPLL